jgi:hypothetical protein
MKRVVFWFLVMIILEPVQDLTAQIAEKPGLAGPPAEISAPNGLRRVIVPRHASPPSAVFAGDFGRRPRHEILNRLLRLNMENI